MTAYLIVSPNPESQEKTLKRICQKLKLNFNPHYPDTLIIKPAKSIGIDQIRQIKDFLSKKNWQGRGKKLVVIWEAQLMTLEAQNAFLKTLEEPPSPSVIFLLARNKSALLATIISRCHLVFLPSLPQPPSIASGQTILPPSSLAQRLQLAQSIGQDREKTKNWLENFIFQLQQKLIQSEDNLTQLAHQIKLAQQARQMLDDNVHPQRVMDWLMLKLE